MSVLHNPRVVSVVEKTAIDRTEYDEFGLPSKSSNKRDYLYVTQQSAIDAQIAAKVYSNIPAINSAIRIGGNSLKHTPWIFKWKTARGEEKQVDNAISNLLSWCNPHQTFADVLVTCWSWDRLLGEYWLAIEPTDEEYSKMSPLSIYPLDPLKVHVVADRDRKYSGVVYGDGDGKIFIPWERLIHGKNFNPHSYWLGHCDLNTLNFDFQIGQFRKKQMANYYSRASTLQGVLSAEGSLGPDEIKKLRKQFQDEYSGARNSYRVLVLEAGMKYEPVKTDPGDSEVDELLRSLDSTQVMVVGVPLQLLSPTTDFKDIIHLEALAWKQTYMPFLNDFACVVSKKLLTPVSMATGKKVWMEFDYRGVDALRLQELDRVRMETAAINTGTRTPNEVRAAANIPPYSGDEIVEKFGELPKPVWDALYGKGASSAASSPSLTLPGTEGGRDQSEFGEAQMVDESGEKS